MALWAEVEESKLPEEVRGTEERPPAEAQLMVLSAAVKSTAPILAASNLTIWAESDKLNVEVIHRESMRTFKAQLRAEDLEKCGFHPRDTAEDCVEIMSDALGAEDIDTVAVTPMASPAEGSDTDTATVKVPFSECEFLHIFFALKLRTKLYEYSFVVSEQKLDAATRTQLQLQSLKQKIEAQSHEMEAMKEAIKAQSKTEMDSMKKMKAAMELMEATKRAMKAQSKTEIDRAMEEKMNSVKAVMATMAAKMEAMEAELDAAKTAMEEKTEAMKAEMDTLKYATTQEIAALKSKGIASYRSNAMFGRLRKWNSVALPPTLDGMVSLSVEQSYFRIGMEGVYRILCGVVIGGEKWREGAQLYINGVKDCWSLGGECTSTVLCFVGRLKIGDIVEVSITECEDGDEFDSNWLQIEKFEDECDLDESDFEEESAFEEESDSEEGSDFKAEDCCAAD